MSEELISKTESKNKPTTFVISNCKLTEFENEVKKADGTSFKAKSILVTKFYKDEKAESGWSETSSFSIQELVKLQILLTEYMRLMSPMKVN